MKNRTIIFTAMAVLFLGFLLTGCTTQKKAVKYFDSHGFQAAQYCASAFPTKDSVGKADTSYHPAKNTDYSQQIDSLKKGFDSQLQAFKDAQKRQADDTSCLRTIRELQGRYEALIYSFDSLHAKYKPCKPDTAYITVPHFVENTANIAALTQSNTILATKLETAENKAGRRGKLMWGTWIAIALLGGGYLFLKSRTALITSVINKIKNKV